MTLATIVNRLKAEATISQVRVNRYRVNLSYRSEQLGVDRTRLYTLGEIHRLFSVEVAPGNYVFRRPESSGTPNSVSRSQIETVQPEPETLRTIRRAMYHSTGGGRDRQGVQDALASIPVDLDGVRRSFGLEWEIYNLTDTQEDRLAGLLDTLPAHVAERDSSLGSRGVEIVFLPMSKDRLIVTFKALKEFCTQNLVSMGGTGAHITYGVSDSEICDINDLQIRLNRIALSVKAASTQRAIKAVFGRDFTGYAHLPQSTTTRDHSNAWSASRGRDAYELRLCCWEGDIDKIVEFLLATEFVFHRTFRAEDFQNIFRIMGCDCSGC